MVTMAQLAHLQPHYHKAQRHRTAGDSFFLLHFDSFLKEQMFVGILTCALEHADPIVNSRGLGL